MTLVQLEYFLHAAEHVNVSAGARAAHVTQPAVSKQVRLLEKELGCPLFVRSKNRLVLTEEGVLLQRNARDLLSRAGAVRDLFHTRTRRVCGRITVGCSASSARQILPEVLKRMLTDYPDVHVAVEEMDWREAHHKLLDREIDVAIGLEMTGDAALIFTPLIESRLIFIQASAMRGRATAKRVSAAELAGLPFVAYPEDNILWQRFLSGYPFASLRTVVKSRFTETVLAYVRSGMGVAVVPEYLVAWSPESRREIRCRELDRNLPVRFGYNTNRDHILSLALRVFLERLTERVRAADVPGRKRKG